MIDDDYKQGHDNDSEGGLKKKDGTPVLLAFREPYEGMRMVGVYRHARGWSPTLPLSFGGPEFVDDWFEGWLPLPGQDR